ncbi:hypothetical protein PR202_gb17054 [Eleusine coracana subsp. coracana]|uniref:Uncharacterized protein n=1 Tax=Eleusine coracana subsp. coracana TaxID=191504 RepID=A0AAV5F2M8_ELECO|nr:hypothetical protein PR202_gb17054 [Eleusine coracana subsp. coracana]
MRDGLERSLLISSARKEELIKFMAQALPTYLMGVFKLTNGLCEEHMKKIRKYWWRRRTVKEGYMNSNPLGLRTH